MAAPRTLSEKIVNAVGTGEDPTELVNLTSQSATLGSLTASAAELNILDGATVSTAEVNLLDQSVVSATATSDGLTTGLIPATATIVTVTSASADNIVTLPTAAGQTVGKKIEVYIGATGCEIRTPDASSQTINGVDGDGTNEYALAANSVAVCTCVSATGWIVYTGGAAAPN